MNALHLKIVRLTAALDLLTTMSSELSESELRRLTFGIQELQRDILAVVSVYSEVSA